MPALVTSVDTAESGIQLVGSGIQIGSDTVDSIQSLINALREAKTSFDSDAAATITNAVSALNNAVYQAQSTLDATRATLPELSSNVSELQDKVNEGTGSIDETLEYVNSLKESLGTLKDRINGISSSDDYVRLREMFSADPDKVLDFLKNPVQLQEETFFEIETYGSAMAPFYTVLALWVGALILVALLKVNVKDEPGGVSFDASRKASPAVVLKILWKANLWLDLDSYIIKYPRMELKTICG